MTCEEYIKKAQQRAIARNQKRRDTIVLHQGAELRRILETLTPDREKAAQQKERSR